MLTPRIAVLVSGNGTNLQALIDAQSGGALTSGEIALVVASRADAHALGRAKESGIKTAVAAYADCASREAFEARLLEILYENAIDVIVLAGFLHILSADFVSRYPERIINVHPSLIPAYCGRGFYGIKVHEAVLAAGDAVTGATVHMVNEVPDGGRVLMQKTVRVLSCDTPETLQRRVMEEAEWQLLPAAAELVCQRARQSLNDGEKNA